MHKILILGCNGFTGRHFVNFAARNEYLSKYELSGVDLQETSALPQSIAYAKIDIADPNSLRHLLERVKPDYILNFAGIFGGATMSQTLHANAELSRTLFESVRDLKLSVKNILVIGSAAEYGKNQNLPLTEDSALLPVSGYGLSKVIQTQYAQYFHRVHGINICVARTFNIIGTGMSVALSIPAFVQQIQNLPNTGTIEVGNLASKRDYLDISEVISAYWEILLHGAPGGIYNVCRGESIKMRVLLDYLIKKSGKTVEISVNPAFVKKNDIMDSYGDNSKLRSTLHWSPKVSVFDALDNFF